jgi:hypothetical protein
MTLERLAAGIPKHESQRTFGKAAIFLCGQPLMVSSRRGRTNPPSASRTLRLPAR